MEDKIKNIKELFKKNQPLFSALGDPHRQEILHIMADNKHLSVIELSTLTNLSRPAVSHHLKILQDTQLVTQHIEGTRRYYHPTFKAHIVPLRALIDKIEEIEL
jgi:ArsR family transcriptional regulator, arsenate/arsenite/antimonite-responsive transcriptional repressor